MERYTTPTIVVQIRGADLTGCDIHVTFRQGRKTVTLTNDDFSEIEIGDDATTVACPLSQLQTARFAEDKPIEVQANVIDLSNARGATNIKTTTFKRQLLEVPRYHG